MTRNVPRSLVLMVLVSASVGVDALADHRFPAPIVVRPGHPVVVRPGHPGRGPVVVVPGRPHRRPRPIPLPISPAPGYGYGPGYGPGPTPYPPAPYPPAPLPPSNGDAEEATDRLFYETDDLSDEVRRNRLHPQIQRTVDDLENSARILEDCVDRVRQNYNYDYNSAGTAAIYQCQNELNQVQYQFQVAAQQLSQVAYQYPQIAREQEDVRQALELVTYLMNGTQPGPNPGPGYSVRATGVLDTLRFRFVGRDQIEVNRQCMNFGYQNRVQYVRSLVVNGRRYDRNQYMNLAEACTIVAQNVVQGM